MLSRLLTYITYVAVQFFQSQEEFLKVVEVFFGSKTYLRQLENTIRLGD